ncbi:nuclear pore complex protein Nup155-like [Saccostrea cucullata]|uniref:nuclear pore complex protein Nup155-like n=1 Tax=Saccostrea cuccullata TaxID=36930 RepID=UPI002ED5C775
MSSFMGTPQFSYQDWLENAARQVDKQLQDDRSYQELSDQLKVPVHNQPSLSGLNELDYPSLPEAGISIENLCEISNVKRVPLPPELVEQFERMQCNCMMGLFPTIERAWLTIDSDIFVWRYEDGTDLAYFDGLNETILSAALVKPKPGIFQPHIQYLLCLATPVDIVLLGVSFSKPYHDVTADSGSGEMHLLPEPLFSIPTDNTYIVSIKGAPNGRIFMAGKDGCLYELAYQADDGWFSRKCRKINHSTSTLSFLVPSFLNFSFSEDDPLLQLSLDDSRNILYACTEKGTIQVFDLGQDGKGMSRVASIPLNNVVHSASLIARTVERSNFKPIVHISALTKSESTNIHLVAITKTGVRLYFTTNPFGNNKGRPSMLTLVHVRLPPGFSASTVVHKPQNVHMAYHKKGTLLLVASQTEDNDLLWTISNDSFPFQGQLMEAHSTIPIDGRTWAMCEVTSGETSVTVDKPDPPSVVTQHSESPRQFVLLSAQGSHIFSKMRPVDQLRQLLIDFQGPDAEEVKAFFRLHKIEQACSTCLILACSRIAADQQVATWATMAFFMYGGEPQLHFTGTPMGTDGRMMPSNLGAMGLHQTSTPAPGMGHPYFHPAMTPGPNITQEIAFSGKHNGICLYLARILRSIWENNVTMDYPCQSTQGVTNYLTSRINGDDLNKILENVRGLSDFVEFNSRFDTGPSEGMMSQVPFSPHMMGHIDEQGRKKLQGNHQASMCGALITCLINRYLDDNATIDAISSRLREVCPSLYSSDDATCSKANELLQAAKINKNQNEKMTQLNEALKLYKEVSQPLQLPVVCTQFALVHYYTGIVDLCLTLAKKRDPQNLALHFYRSGEPQEDIQGMTAYMTRMECYNCITDTLAYLLSASVSHPHAPSVPKSPGPPPQPDPNRMTTHDAEKHKEEVFRMSLKSDDELFHVALYDWFFNANLTEKLLEVQTPFIEPYLKRKATCSSEAIGALDMLWKYYEKCRNFSAAARILSRLAERLGTDVNLQQRIEYLSRAIMCAKSSSTRTSSAVEGEFLHELEEKMEVARLQLQVQRALSKLPSNILDVQYALTSLDSELMDLTRLYEDFADRFDLSECKLAIVHCAGLYDGALIENLWQNIIDKEIEATINMNPGLRTTNLQNKLLPIGRLYIKSDRYFPIAFLVKHLEQRSCDLDLNTRWVFLLMLDIGVPPSKLLEIYDRLFKSRDPYWQQVQKPLRLLEVLHDLLSHICENRAIIPAYERRSFTTMCLDFVSNYLVELQTMRSTPQQAAVVSHFKRLQAQLERF